MNYPDDLYKKMTEISLKIDIEDFSSILYCIKLAGESGYKLGLEKGWQYQQEEDNASRQWESDDE